jgi:hypothetical protein
MSVKDPLLKRAFSSEERKILNQTWSLLELMAQIGFFTPQHHSFYLYYLSRIGIESAHDVRVYAPSDVHNSIESLYTDEEYDSIKWIIADEMRSVDKFFQRVETASKDIDLLWTVLAWGTGRVPPNLLEFDPDPVHVAGITNLNDWTCNPFPDRVYDLIKRGTPLLRQYVETDRIDTLFDHLRYLMQPGIIETFDAVHIEYPPMHRFFQNQVDWNVDVFEFPPIVFEESSLPTVEQTTKKRIAVPGRISQNVRNIDQVLTAMERVFEHYSGNVILDFVGRLTGDYESALKRIEMLQNQGYDVRYREEWIPYDEFAAALRAADIIINPLHVRRTISHPFRADMWTGRTNGTGIIFDALRYARPLVVPELFSVDERLRPFTETYDNIDHLVKIVLELLENEDRLADLQSRADAAAAEVTPEAQRPKFENIVDNILQSKHDNNIE